MDGPASIFTSVLISSNCSQIRFSVTLKLWRWNKNCILEQLDDMAMPVMLIFGIYISDIGSRPKSLIKVTKMVSESRNHASTATTNLLSFTKWSNNENKYSNIQNNN